MRRDAATDEDDPTGALGREFEQTGWEKTARDDDVLAVGVGLLVGADEVVHEPQGQVLDVIGLLSHVGVIAREKGLHVVGSDGSDGGGGSDAGLHLPADLVEKVPVLQDHQMGGEDQRSSVGELALNSLLKLLELGLGVRHGGVKILKRVRPAGITVHQHGEALLLVENHGRGIGEPLRGHFAFDELEVRRQTAGRLGGRLMDPHDELGVLDDIGELGGDGFQGPDIRRIEALVRIPLEHEDAHFR